MKISTRARSQFEYRLRPSCCTGSLDLERWGGGGGGNSPFCMLIFEDIAETYVLCYVYT